MANARTGGGQRAGEHEGSHSGTLHDRRGVVGEDIGVVPGVVSDDDGAPRCKVLPSGSEPGPRRIEGRRPRFMRFGPGPSGPRRPAVPKCRRPAKQSASSASSASMSRSSSLRVTGSGSWSSHARAMSWRSMEQWRPRGRG